MKRLFWTVMILALVAAFCAPALAGPKEDAQTLIKECEIVLDKMMAQDDKDSFKWFLKKAKALAIFPGMVKAGFVVGGRYGKGVVLAQRKDGTFSPPAFYSITGASLGLQIGAQSMDVIMVVVKQKGVNALVSQKFKLGADVSVAAGPMGRGASAGANPTLDSAIYTFAMTKGLFAGASLDGAGMSAQEELNKAYYGRAYTSRDILLLGQAPMQASAKDLISKVVKYSK